MFIPQNFVNQVGPPVSASWLNGVDLAVYSGQATSVYTPPGVGALPTTVGAVLNELIGINSAGGAIPLVQPTVTAPTDVQNFGIIRNAAYTGGTPGFVNSALRATINVGSNVTDFEWAIIGIVNNSATSGQNVGVYGQGNKLAGAGATWGGVMQAQDTSNNSDPTTGLIGLEVDIDANGTDANNQRIGIDVVVEKYAAGGTAPTVYAGLRVGPLGGLATNATFNNGILLNGNMVIGLNFANTFNLGIDLSGATFSTGSAIRLPSGVAIGFDSASLNNLKFDSTGLGYYNGTQLIGRMNQTDGSFQYGGAPHIIVLKPTFGTASAAAVLTANKPGATTAVATWQEIDIDGTAYVYPLWLKA